MATQKYWMRNAEGEYAQIDGAAERDRWIPLGWSAVDEPADDRQVWMRADGIEMPARYPYGAREFWQGRGWTFSAPPEPVDLTKDPALSDQPTPEPVKAEPASKKEGK